LFQHVCFQALRPAIRPQCLRMVQPAPVVGGGCGRLLGSRTDGRPRAQRDGLKKNATARVGDAIPNVALDLGFPPEKVMLGDYCRGKKVVLVGLPGAFTPT